MRAFFAAAVLFAAPAYAQTPISISVETDKKAYTYGETIVITIDATNQSDQPHTVWGSSSCRAMYRIDEFDVAEYVPCTLDDSPVVYAPGATRRWIWEVDPAHLGIPRVEGTTHTVTGYHLYVGGEKTVEVEAPAFVGGFVDVLFAAGQPPDVLQPVRDSLNAEVVDREEHGSTISERWRIEGTLLDEAIERYHEDPRFLRFDPIDFIETPHAFFVTGTEETPEAEGLRVEAAPNPFAGALRIEVTPPRTEGVRVEVFDLRGRRVAVLYDGVLRGQVPHPITWQPARLGNGVYVVRFSGSSFTWTQRVTYRR